MDNKDIIPEKLEDKDITTEKLQDKDTINQVPGLDATGKKVEEKKIGKEDPTKRVEPSREKMEEKVEEPTKR